MGKSKLLWVAIVAVMVSGCSSNSAKNDSEEMQEVGTIQEVKEIVSVSAWDMLETQYVQFKENELMDSEDSVLVGFCDGAYINKVVGNENNIYKYYVNGDIELIWTIDSKYSSCEFENYEDGIVVLAKFGDNNEMLDVLTLDYESNEVENIFSGKEVEAPEILIDNDNVTVVRETENKVVIENKNADSVYSRDSKESSIVCEDREVTKLVVNSSYMYFCDFDKKVDAKILMENNNNILYKNGVMEFENNIVKYTTFKDISGSVFSDGYIDNAYPDYVPTTEYEQVAYDAFVERFGEDRKIIDIVSVVEENEDAEIGVVDQYLEFIDVEIVFLMNENSGNLSGGYNTFNYELGLADDGEYLLLGSELLG